MVEVLVYPGISGSDFILPNGEPYHLRCDVDQEAGLIYLGVFDLDGKLHVVEIQGATPFMGHPKKDDCCGG